MSGFPVHLMRHGAPETPGLLLGHLDAPPERVAMAPCLERARRVDFGRVVSSDLARARLPAEAIAAEHDVAHQLDPRWRELHFGAWEGADPAALPGEDLGRFWDDPDANPPPQGERWSDLAGRIGAAARDLSGPVLVVSHAGAMRAALATLCGFTYGQAWAFDLPYGALLSLVLWPGDRPRAQITGLIT